MHNFSAEDSMLSHLEMAVFASVRNAHDLTCQLGPGEPSDCNEAFKETTVQAQLSAFAAEGDIEAPVRTLAQEQWIMEGDGDIIQKLWAHLGKLGLAPWKCLDLAKRVLTVFKEFNHPQLKGDGTRRCTTLLVQIRVRHEYVDELAFASD